MSLSTIDVGGLEYPVYATLGEADAYLIIDPVLGTVWASLTGEPGEIQKEKHLAAATRRLDELPWAGERTTATQTSEWPRTGLTDDQGNDLPDDAVPVELERAAILLAASLVSTPRALVAGDTSQAAVTETVGPRTVSRYYRRQSRAERRFGNPQAYRLIQRWLAGAVPRPPTVTGTDGVSSFERPDSYGRTEGIA